MRFDILTIFPHLFDSFLHESLLHKAQKQGILKVCVHNIRAYSQNKQQQVDDRPFGGGPGMVLQIEPIYRALTVLQKQKNTHQPTPSLQEKTVLLSPRGAQFTQQHAREYARCDRIIFIAGRYEGIDARVESLVDDILSIGPYVISGGELPAMVVIEAVSRLLPGFVGNATSITRRDNSLCAQTENIEYPVYTRPETFITHEGRELSVPAVLLSGSHKKIALWRKSHGTDIAH